MALNGAGKPSAARPLFSNPEKGTIGVLPMGKIPGAALSAVSKHIPTFFRHDAKILTSLPIPSYAIDKRRGQYNAANIISTLESRPLTTCQKVLAIVNVDLFIPIFTHVMGEAREGGNFALVSMYRLTKNPSGEGAPSFTILDRLVKVALHELGHLFDLVHCENESCLMHFAGNIEEIDQISISFCTYCQKYLEETVTHR